MPRIITVGEILVEVMTKNTGQEFLYPGELTGPYPSGAPAIFIDQVARMGVGCGIIARVGADDFGRLNIDRLQKDGTDVSHIYETLGYTTGTAFVTYYEDGSRKFIFHFAHSAAGFLGPGDIDEGYFKNAEFLHIMGCSLSAGGSMRDAIRKAVEIAKKDGIKVSFDPNIRPELLGDKEVRIIFDDLLSVTDILLSGESEIRALTGYNGIDSTIAELKGRGISIIVLKNGSKGIKVYYKDEVHYIPPFKVKEVDPTGAGDCFDGAFISCLANGESIRDAAVIANAAGALSVTRKGPMEGASFKNDIMDFVRLNTK